MISRCGIVPVMDATGDQRLVAAASRGDERAFGDLYDLYVEAVFLQAARELGSEDGAEDVTQEVFAIAWRKLAKIRMVNGSILPWLLQTCRNVTANRLRSASRRPVTTDFDDQGPNVLEAELLDARLDSRMLMDRVEKEVATMPFLDQQVYHAIISQGASYEETSRALDISIPSVRKRLNRVRSRLKGTLGGAR
ncbi:RNA polymerase sigma-70 factor, ECF subfamily [Cryobacterium flavum]|uniref:RNA polymerase sigma-70 factor, ECF subfamily n=2 Tax=Cryobacterium flavum TaxID=1424659 RepID=A0A5E9G3X7_9MICO|nr:RNA polymerase sigma-70 factor, ECF subfamily [Cryobacterium flavum]